MPRKRRVSKIWGLPPDLLSLLQEVKQFSERLRPGLEQYATVARQEGFRGLCNALSDISYHLWKAKNISAFVLAHSEEKSWGYSEEECNGED